MKMTIKEVLRNLIDKMITEDIKLYTIDVTEGDTTVFINTSVYVDISNIDEGEFSTGVVNGEQYTLSTSENLDKVIELLKEN